MSDQKKDIHDNRSLDEKDDPEISMVNITKNAIEEDRHVDVTAMIRSLQRTEGVTDCFRRGLTECELPDCAWRKYCLSRQDD